MLAWDRGTLVVDDRSHIDPEGLPGVLWDPRTRCWRAPAWRYRELAAILDEELVTLEARPRSPPALRPYQESALAAWKLAGRRGIVVLPTGAGKTRTAIAALAEAGLSTLCITPTRVLVHQWRRALLAAGIAPVGQLGDGVRVVERVTVATAASARAHAERLGHRFALLVVDEVHHHGGDDETLELYASPFRLGLTATFPSDPVVSSRLLRLVGPVVSRLAVDDLAGTWLATYDLLRVAVDLDPAELLQYRIEVGSFQSVYAGWARTTGDRTWQAFVRAASRTDEGRRALAAWRRARDRVAWSGGKDRALAALLHAHRASRTLVFTRDNRVAYAIARAHLVAPLTCDIGRDERARRLAAFASGSLHALVSARVLNEGIDVPEAEVAILTGGSHGDREYVQRVGRVLRPRDGKRALVVELVTRETHEVRESTRNRRRLAAS